LASYAPELCNKFIDLGFHVILLALPDCFFTEVVTKACLEAVSIVRKGLINSKRINSLDEAVEDIKDPERSFSTKFVGACDCLKENKIANDFQNEIDKTLIKTTFGNTPLLDNQIPEFETSLIPPNAIMRPSVGTNPYKAESLLAFSSFEEKKEKDGKFERNKRSQLVGENSFESPKKKKK
jgi:hypothetical protein